MAAPSDHDIILALGEELPVGLWVARAPNGEEVYANRTFAQIMGTDLVRDAQVGGYAAPYGICTRDGQPYPEHRMPFVRALEERRVVVSDDLTIRRPDGTAVDVRAFARPVVSPAGEITHVIIAFFDITREVEAERARAESEQRLYSAQRLEAIGTLAGGIAHDFNNLIFGIKLIAAELAAAEVDPQRRASFALIDDITDRSAALTRSLLGFARRGKHRAMPVCLSDVVASMAELLRRTSSGVELEFELEARDRGVVIGDHAQLEQLIMNLVGNAREALDGSGRIAIRTRNVELAGPPARAVGVAGEGPHVVLEVSDDGPGIPLELRERVFEPYFTTKLQGPERGTGLGLATVFGIVELHGGSIEIDVGFHERGTTMRVYLPAALAQPQPQRSPSAVHGPIAPGSGLMLIVDDDAIVRRALATTLDALGYQPLEAASGPEALELCRLHADELRAVLLDMVMPVMSGRSTYLGLREIAPAIPVVLMSGFSLDAQVQDILGLGVRAFLSKPYSVEQLAALLAELHPAGRRRPLITAGASRQGAWRGGSPGSVRTRAPGTHRGSPGASCRGARPSTSVRRFRIISLPSVYARYIGSNVPRTACWRALPASTNPCSANSRVACSIVIPPVWSPSAATNRTLRSSASLSMPIRAWGVRPPAPSSNIISSV